LVLLVSGGHTEMIRVDGPGRYQRLARSRDDAAGEAFDKVARLLELGYPGGPAIQLAAEHGDPQRFVLPKGRVSLPEGGFHPYDFSFSGLKTAVLRLVNQLKAHSAKTGEPFPLADVAASFEKVVADVLVERTTRCAREQGLNTLVMVGGVAANRRLRQRLEQRCFELGIQWRLAPLAYCTDNAAMIAVAAEQRWLMGATSPIDLAVAPRLALEAAPVLYEPQAAF
jgi:N6-L-threonylcarbamoyladenine synthase